MSQLNLTAYQDGDILTAQALNDNFNAVATVVNGDIDRDTNLRSKWAVHAIPLRLERQGQNDYRFHINVSGSAPTGMKLLGFSYDLLWATVPASPWTVSISVEVDGLEIGSATITDSSSSTHGYVSLGGTSEASATAQLTVTVHLSGNAAFEAGDALLVVLHVAMGVISDDEVTAW